MSTFRTEQNGHAIALTARQREVLALVAMGKSACEIAAALDITPRTVRAHTDALRIKLGTRRCRELPLAYRIATGRDPMTDAPAGMDGPVLMR